MIKKAILATTVLAGLCGLGVALLRSGWLSSGPEEAVRARAIGYWNERVAGAKLEKLAPFLHPLQATAQESTMLSTDSYEITKVEVTGDTATVGIKAQYHVQMAQTSTLKRELESADHWVRYKGEWYHALHPVGFGEVLAQGIGKWKPPTAPPAAAAPKQPAVSEQPAASIPKP